MAAKDELGRRGERIAEEHLVGEGAEVLDRNWRCRHGELDLVVREDREIVFVEVKTRTGIAYGHPLEAVTPVKLRRLRRLAGAWCDEHPGERGSIRIDVIGIVAPRDSTPTITRLRGVF